MSTNPVLYDVEGLELEYADEEGDALYVTVDIEGGEIVRVFESFGSLIKVSKSMLDDLTEEVENIQGNEDRPMSSSQECDFLGRLDDMGL